METGENIQALRKILDLIRFSSILVLIFHFYITCYAAFYAWGLVSPLSDRLLGYVVEAGPFFLRPTLCKTVALGLLILSVIGVRGKKSEKLSPRSVFITCLTGLALYYAAALVYTFDFSVPVQAICYVIATALGYSCFLAGAMRVSRLLKLNFQKDIFNELNETFPQEERLLTNEYSINIPAAYQLKGQTRRSYINCIAPFRSTLLCGTAGSGKSWFIVRAYLTQMISKGYTLFLYDYKFPDLTLIAYNWALRNRDKYPVPPKFYFINFDDLTRTHRCNPLSPETMLELTDATESSRTFMLSLNRQWITKQGDFFVESPINFLTALIWFLRKYADGRYCTLPHVIELAQVPYDKLFPILNLEPEIDALINPFVSAYQHGAAEQLEGQIASAKISLARLVSPSLYYVLSGNDFTLDINNPQKPKLVCVGNNPTKQQTYGAVISLYAERMLKLVNRKKQLKSALIFDEYPTIYADVGPTISTGRSNLVACLVCVQDVSQLRKDYGKEQAEVIMNVAGNIISGQVLGDSAKMLSDRIGKIMQERESISINASDTSVSKSAQLESAIPASRISNLSSGEFVGAMADTPSQQMSRKVFHATAINDPEAIAREEASYEPLPILRTMDDHAVQDNFTRIKEEVRMLVETEWQRVKPPPPPPAKAAATAVSL